jgi:formate hydrogenlyase subunit 4
MQSVLIGTAQINIGDIGGEFQSVAFLLIRAILLLLISPLIVNVIRRVKAYFQRRKGPGLLQGYFDLWRLLKKDAVISEHASWIFMATPYIVFSATLIAGALVPSFLVTSVPKSGFSDAILLIYLLGLARFFTVIAGLDTGSSFGGMGSSRESMISALVEPVIMSGMLILAMSAETTNIAGIVGKTLATGFVQPVYILLLLAFLIVTIAETGRVPVDNPATHLELTMVHEAMILEYSGRHLALIEWASAVKLSAFLILIANLFFPWGIATAFTFPAIVVGLITVILKTAFLAILIAIIESSIAKLRLFRVPELIGGSFALVMLALIIRITGMG